jgi:hypothetical protein
MTTETLAIPRKRKPLRRRLAGHGRLGWGPDKAARPNSIDAVATLVVPTYEALPEEAKETPNVHAASPLGSRRLPSAAQLKCSLDELVVGRYPAVGGEDHELEAGAEHLAIR